MERRRPMAALLALGAAIAFSAPALAALPATPTADLIPGPPVGDWTESPDDVGPITADDFYGAPNSPAPGFSDAYGKGWSNPDLGLADDLLHYTSLFWAAYALADFRQQAQSDPDRTSFADITGFGSSAFEVTYPPGTDGYAGDWIFFSRGDYMAAIVLSGPEGGGHAQIVDQAKRQLSLLPSALAEYRTIGFGVLGGVLAVAIIVALMLASGLVVAIVLYRRHQMAAPAAGYAVAHGIPGGPHLSEDRRHWWDGQSWQDAAVHIPPGAQISPDGTRWWDGAEWREMPPSGSAA